MKSFSILLCSASLLVFGAGCSSAPRPGDVLHASQSSSLSSEEIKALNEANRPSDDAARPKAKKKESKDPFALVTCVNGLETRTMAIGTHTGDGAGCEVRYEKNEKVTMVPAYSSFGNDHCLQARDKMRANLVKAGWKCAQ